MNASTRYEPINTMFGSLTVPPCTRREAEKATRAIVKKFGRKSPGAPFQVYDLRAQRVRRCWITTTTNAGLNKGWQRLVHDLSHVIFRARYPNHRPHNAIHAAVEAEIAAWVVAQGWLDGALLPRPKAKPSAEQRVQARIASLLERRKAWQSKAARARTALKKIQRSLRHYERKQPALLAAASGRREDKKSSA